MTAKTWEVSALVDLETGLVGRPTEMDRLPVPQDVEPQRLERFPRFLGHEEHHYRGRAPIRGGQAVPEEFLSWSSPAALALDPTNLTTEDFFSTGARSQGKVHTARPDPKMLDRFLDLANAPAEDIVHYARQWGVLGICRHGRPCTHTPFTKRRPLPPAPDLCVPLGWTGTGGLEPVAAWRKYSRMASAIIGVAERLRTRPQLVDPEKVWTVTGRPGAYPGTPSLAGELKSRAWPIVVAAINGWIVDGDVRPWVTLRPHSARLEPRIRYASPWWVGEPSWPLFGVLGFQLALAVCTTTHTPCEACGGPRARGQRRFCGKKECQRTAARLRQQNLRARRRRGTRPVRRRAR